MLFYFILHLSNVEFHFLRSLTYKFNFTYQFALYFLEPPLCLLNLLFVTDVEKFFWRRSHHWHPRLLDIFIFHRIVLQKHFVSVAINIFALREHGSFYYSQLLYLLFFWPDFEKNFLVFLLDIIQVRNKLSIFFYPLVDFIIFPKNIFFICLCHLIEWLFKMQNLFGQFIDPFWSLLFLFFIFVDISLHR